MSEFIFKICGLAIISVMLILLIKKWGNELSVLLKIASGVLLASVCFGAVSPLVEYIKELSLTAGSADVAESVELMLRVLATAIVTHVCASVCRDSGEGTIGSYVETGGKVEMILLTLPMIKKIIDLTVGMI